jgi:hypothetical protein
MSKTIKIVYLKGSLEVNAWMSQRVVERAMWDVWGLPGYTKNATFSYEAMVSMGLFKGGK